MGFFTIVGVITFGFFLVKFLNGFTKKQEDTYQSPKVIDSESEQIIDDILKAEIYYKKALVYISQNKGEEVFFCVGTAHNLNPSNSTYKNLIELYVEALNEAGIDPDGQDNPKEKIEFARVCNFVTFLVKQELKL